MQKLLAAIAVVALAGLLANTSIKPAPKAMLRHVVLFKFKDNAPPADVAKVEEAFRGLKSKIREIKSFEWGTNVSPEGLAQGFTHCFFVTFESEKDRDTYLPHPEHKKFTEIVGPVIDKVCVVDYWTKE